MLLEYIKHRHQWKDIKKERNKIGEPEAEVMEEWRRETQVLTKRGSRETQLRTTQLADW